MTDLLAPSNDANHANRLWWLIVFPVLLTTYFTSVFWVPALLLGGQALIEGNLFEFALCTATGLSGPFSLAVAIRVRRRLLSGTRLRLGEYVMLVWAIAGYLFYLYVSLHVLFIEYVFNTPSIFARFPKIVFLVAPLPLVSMAVYIRIKRHELKACVRRWRSSLPVVPHNVYAWCMIVLPVLIAACGSIALWNAGWDWGLRMLGSASITHNAIGVLFFAISLSTPLGVIVSVRAHQSLTPNERCEVFTHWYDQMIVFWALTGYFFYLYISLDALHGIYVRRIMTNFAQITHQEAFWVAPLPLLSLAVYLKESWHTRRPST